MREPRHDTGLTKRDGWRIRATRRPRHARMEPMSKHTAVATFKTSLGDIRVNLFGNHAPKTVRNFTGLAKGEIEWTDPATGEKTSRPLYDGTIFHRIIDDFMIQGGDPLGQGTGGPGYRVRRRDPPRAHLHRALPARDGQRRQAGGRGTNGSQFFISTVPTTWLQGAHTIFGEVADEASRDVVKKIESGREGPGRSSERGCRDRVGHDRRGLSDEGHGVSSGSATSTRPLGQRLLPASRPAEFHPLPALRAHDLLAVPDAGRRRRALPRVRA